MRRCLLSIVAAILACAVIAHAKPRGEAFSATTTTNAYGSVALDGVSGYIDEIIAKLPAGTTVTGTVYVLAAPPIGSAVTLATNTITADKTFRPRLDGTDTAGSALTGDPPGRYLAIGDTLTYYVVNANTTGLTWEVYIKWDDGK